MIFRKRSRAPNAGTAASVRDRRGAAILNIAILLIVTLAFLPSGSGNAAEDLAQAYRQGFEALRDDKVDQALPHFERALEIAERQYGVDDPRTAVELNNVGEVFRLVGDNERAIAYLKRALAIEQEHGNSVSIATAMNNLALANRSLNRLGEAEEYYEQALQLLQNGLGPNHPDVAKTLNNLALIYAAEGHPERAGTMLDRAVRISTEAVGPDHPTTKLLARNRARLQQAALTVPSPTLRPHSSEREATKTSSNRDGRTALAALHRPIRRPSVSKTAAQSAASGRWVIHLASMRDAASVGEAWMQLRRNFPMLEDLPLIELAPIEIADEGTFHRVAAGEFSSPGEGQELCDRLEAIGQYCRVMHP